MNPIATLVVGLIIGMALVAGLVVSVMRTRMVTVHRSRRSFVDTCTAIERAVPAVEGWGFPIETWNFYETFAKKDLVPAGFVKLKVYFVCNAGLASRMLAKSPAFVGMMPCSWAVFEMADGSVNVSKMNVGLLSRMFDGIVGKSMQEVGRMDEVFMGDVLGTA